MAKKLHLCRWSHCRCDSREIQPDDEVKIGGSYYHKACAEEKQTIDEILKVWHEQIDENVVYTTLRSVVNNLIYKRGYDAGYVLACVKDGAKGKWLHYPQGLYQTCGDQKRLAEWKRAEAKRKLEEMPKPEVKAENIYTPTEQDIGYRANRRRRGFGGILVGRQVT